MADENTTETDDLVPTPVDDDTATDDNAESSDDTTTTESTETDDTGASGDDADDKPKPKPTDNKAAPGIDWKAMARKWEKRAKENADAKKRLDSATQADKTEMEQLREAIEALRTENESNKLKALRSNVSSQTGVPVELLTATTEEDLAEQAESILSFATAKLEAEAANKPKTKATESVKPKEKLRSGGAGAKPEMSRQDVLEAVLGKGRKRNN